MNGVNVEENCREEHQENNGMTMDEDEDDSDYDLGFQDIVPYSSSSVDSIPWADDAIKQNQRDWERVEKMLSGDLPLPASDKEPELRNEILEWHRKFPQLCSDTTEETPKRPQLINQQTQSFDSSMTQAPIDDDDILEIDTLSNLSLNTADGELSDNDTYNGIHHHRSHAQQQQPSPQAPPPPIPRRHSLRATTHALRRVFGAMTHGVPPKNGNVNDELCVTSVPVRLRQRHRHQEELFTFHQRRNNGSASSGTSAPLTPTGTGVPPYIKHEHLRQPTNNYQLPTMPTTIRMPPIVNVLESKRRFVHGRLSGHRSFVQLTHLPQAKSAATVSQEPIEAIPPKMEVRRPSQQSAWRLPLAATTMRRCFLSNNNRNAIILPALDLQRIGIHHALSAEVALTSTPTQSDNRSNRIAQMDGSSTVNTSDGGTGAGFGNSAMRQVRGAYHHQRNNHQNLHRQMYQMNFNDHTSTTTPTSMSMGSGGRSISAAVVQPRSEMRAFYLPYSAATKFKAFK